MKRVIWGGGLAICLLLLPAVASAALIWDSDLTQTGVQDGSGTWVDAGKNWWDADKSENVAWDNTNPVVAQFGSAFGTSTPTITVDGTVKSTGVTGNHAFSYVPDSTNGGTIEMNGDTFTVSVHAATRFYTPLTTAAGVNKIVFQGNGDRTDEYVYLYNANSFDAPIEIGEAEGCNVFVSSGSGTTTPIVLPPSTAGLGGDPTKSITVFYGSTLGLRSNTVVDKPIILKGGDGNTGRGNLEFYGNSFASEVRGSVTLEGDTTIETRATGNITGSLTGDFNLYVRSAASNRPGAITLANTVNASNSLTLSSPDGDDAVIHLILSGNYVADEFVTIGGNDGAATIRSGATLTSPSVAVNNRGVLRGIGMVNADVVVAAGGTIEGGEADIYNPNDSVYYLDVESTIGTLTVTGDVTVAGTVDVEYDGDNDVIDLLAVSGQLDLTGATLSFSNIGTGLLGPGPHVFATYGTLTGAPATEVNVPSGWQVVYGYNGNSIALVPEPTTIGLLLGLGLVVAGWRRRTDA